MRGFLDTRIASLSAPDSPDAAEQVEHGNRIFRRLRAHAVDAGAPMFSRMGTKVRPVSKLSDDAEAYRFGYGRIPIAGDLDAFGASVFNWREGDDANRKLFPRWTGEAYLAKTLSHGRGDFTARPLRPTYGDSVLLAALSGDILAETVPDGHQEAGVNLETWRAAHKWGTGFSDKSHEVVGLFGVMLDLDVKEGAAESTAHALEQLHRSGIPSAFVVQSSASGGLHAAVLFRSMYVPDQSRDLGLVARALWKRLHAKLEPGIKFDSFGHLKQIRLPGGLRSCDIDHNGTFSFSRASLIEEDWNLCPHPEAFLAEELEELRQENSGRNQYTSGGYIPRVQRKISEGDAIDRVIHELGQGYSTETGSNDSQFYRLSVCPGCGESDGNPFVSPSGYLRCWRMKCEHNLRKCRHFGCDGDAVSESDHVCGSCAKGTGTPLKLWLSDVPTTLRSAFIEQWRSDINHNRPHIDPMARTEQGLSEDLRKRGNKGSDKIESPKPVPPNSSIEHILSRVVLGGRTHACISQRVTVTDLRKAAGRHGRGKRQWYGFEDDRSGLIEQLIGDFGVTIDNAVIEPALKCDLDKWQALNASQKALTPKPSPAYVIPPEIRSTSRLMRKQSTDIHPDNVVDQRGKRLTDLPIRSFRCTQWEWSSLNGYYGSKPCSTCPVKAECYQTPGRYLHDFREALGNMQGISAVYTTANAISNIGESFNPKEDRFILLDPVAPTLGRKKVFDFSPKLMKRHQSGLVKWFDKRPDEDRSEVLDEFARKRASFVELTERLSVAAAIIEQGDSSLFHSQFTRAMPNTFEDLTASITLKGSGVMPSRPTIRDGILDWIKRNANLNTASAAHIAQAVSACVGQWIYAKEVKSMDLSADIRDAVYSLREDGYVSHDCLDAVRDGWRVASKGWEKVEKANQLPVSFTGWCLEIARASLDRGGVYVRALTPTEGKSHAGKLKGIRELFPKLTPNIPQVRIAWTDMGAVKLWNEGAVSSIGFAPLPESIRETLGHVEHLVNHVSPKRTEIACPAAPKSPRSWNTSNHAGGTGRGVDPVKQGPQYYRAALLDSLGQIARSGKSVAIAVTPPKGGNSLGTITVQRAAAFDNLLAPQDSGITEGDRLPIPMTPHSIILKGVDSPFQSDELFDCVIDAGVLAANRFFGTDGMGTQAIMQTPMRDYLKSWEGYDLTPPMQGIKGRPYIAPIPFSPEGRDAFAWYSWRAYSSSVFGRESFGFQGRDRLGNLERGVEWRRPLAGDFRGTVFGLEGVAYLPLGDPLTALACDQKLNGLPVSGFHRDQQTGVLAMLRVSPKREEADARSVLKIASAGIVSAVVQGCGEFNASGTRVIRECINSKRHETHGNRTRRNPLQGERAWREAARVLNRMLDTGEPTPGRSLAGITRSLARALTVAVDRVRAREMDPPPLPWLADAWLAEAAEWPSAGAEVAS